MGLKLRFSAALAAIALAFSIGSAAAQQAPRITWQSILDLPMYGNGLVRFHDVDIAFAPKQPGPMMLYLKNEKGETLGKYSFYDTYRMTDAVFARQAIDPSSQYTFTPGIYALQYAVNNQAATQFVFKVDTLEVSDDPFNPKTTYQFIGPWQQYGYLTFPEARNFDTGEDVPGIKLHFWVGQQDKPSTVKKGNLFATLLKDGKVIAHSKQTLGYLGNKWLQENDLRFYVPHERGKEVNARPFYKADLLAQDGRYLFGVYRREDNKIIRGYEVMVKDGALMPLPETALTYEKGHQIIIPRAHPKGKQNFGPEPAFWIKRPKAG